MTKIRTYTERDETAETVSERYARAAEINRGIAAALSESGMYFHLFIDANGNPAGVGSPAPIDEAELSQLLGGAEA